MTDLALKLLRQFAASHCDTDADFLLGFPYWYRNLELDADCQPVFTSLYDTWTVLANVLDILIRFAAVAAVVVIIYGGIRYIISQGEPDNLQAAKQIITYAVIGLVIAILASTIVGFIAGRF